MPGLFGGGGAQTQGQQLTQAKPWSAAQPHLKNVMSAAEKYFGGDKGYNYPGFDTYVGFSKPTEQAMGDISQMARAGSPFMPSSIDVTKGLISGQYNPDISGYKGLLGNTSNDAFEAALNTQIGNLGDDISRQFGDSSFGSAAHSGTLAEQLGDVRTKAMAENFFNRANLERGLLGDVAGMKQLGVQNRLAGLANAPGLYEQMFRPAERLAGVGAQREDLAARRLQDKINRFNAKDMAPWNRLGAYSGLAGGFGQLGGTTTQTVTPPSNPWGGALGGGLLGGQMFGVPGALGGGLLGLLSGL